MWTEAGVYREIETEGEAKIFVYKDGRFTVGGKLWEWRKGFFSQFKSIFF